ncbi:hypothetical protein ACTXT7_004323 [Hymenolepis weldensis]
MESGLSKRTPITWYHESVTVFVPFISSEIQAKHRFLRMLNFDYVPAICRTREKQVKISAPYWGGMG